jgi:hypothetical protein
MTQATEAVVSEKKYYPRAASVNGDPKMVGMGGDTVWENPTDKDVILPLHVGSTQTAGLKRPPTYVERHGIDKKIVPAHSIVSISSEFDLAIQDTHCNEQECIGDRRGCRSTTHNKTVVGGLGPQLINRGMEVRPNVHTALLAYEAELTRVTKSLKETEYATMKLEASRREAEAELAELKQQIEAAKVTKSESAQSSGREFVAPPKKSQ